MRLVAVILLLLTACTAEPPGSVSQPLSSAEIRLWWAQKEYYEALCAPLTTILDDSPEGYRCAEPED